MSLTYFQWAAGILREPEVQFDVIEFTDDSITVTDERRMTPQQRAEVLKAYERHLEQA